MPPIQHVTDWLALPKLDIPVIRSEKESGKTYQILKVGFAAVQPADCEKHDIAADVVEMGRCLLPTCVVRSNAEDALHQLPLSLARWAFQLVGAASMGANPFPAKVEFGLLRDREYAQIL